MANSEAPAPEGLNVETREQQTFCRICEPACPLTATVRNEEIVGLAPPTVHPLKSVACHKGLAYLDIHHSDDRLNYPLRRRAAEGAGSDPFERISWDDAIAECAEKLGRLRDEYGPNAVALYVGNPTAFNTRFATNIGAFAQMLGTQMVFSANTQDMANRMTAGAAFYGSEAVMLPDLPNTDYLLCMGANPRVSKWTVVSTANDSGKTLEAIKSRGGKVVFINPRETESSTPETGETLRIRPGADVYFLAALLHEIHRLGGIDEEIVDRYCNGLEELLAFASEFPPERVAAVTGLGAESIVGVARDFCAARGACIYVSLGVNQSRQGLLAAFLADAICFVTGNFGREGGLYKPTGFTDFFPPSTLGQFKVQTSLGELAYTTPGRSPLPLMALPELIENGDVKALVVFAGNPVISSGGEEAWRSAFEKLELSIALDIQRNTTAELCDYLLPGTDFLERSDVNLVAQGAQPIPCVQYADPVVAPRYERRDDWRSLLDIAAAMGLAQHQDPDGWGIVNGMLAARGLSIDELQGLPDQLLFLEPTPHGDGYEKLLNYPDKKVRCYPPEFVEHKVFERCRYIFEELEKESSDTLKMVTLRTTYMHNSWLANVKQFRRGAQSINPLHMSEEDAERRGLVEGAAVRVFNAYGSLETILRVDKRMRPGAVAMSHGYGPGRAAMRVAEAYPGANPNRLAPTGRDTIEPISNMSWISAYPVEVEMAGEQHD